MRAPTFAPRGARATLRTPPRAATTDHPAPPVTFIVSDVDGTLLNSQHALTPRVAASVAAAEAAGVPFVWATGKAPRARWVPPALAALGGAPRPGVYLQGAILEDETGCVCDVVDCAGRA